MKRSWQGRHIIIGDKNLIAFISLLFIQKKCIQKIIFLKKVCLGVGFPSQVSSSRESGKCKGRVMHQWINYANVGFILLQPTKGFLFQKNKNVRFNSGSFSPERFLWKVKQYDVVYIFFFINKLLRYRCLEFTILKRTWYSGSKSFAYVPYKWLWSKI